MHVETRVTPGKSFVREIVENEGSTPQRYVFLRHDLASQLAFDAPLLQCAGFEVRCASSGLRRSRSEELCRRMYALRGYKHTVDPADTARALTVTFQACRGNSVFGTITVQFDSPEGLAADALYRREIDAYRSAGATVCELTRLALSNEHGSKQSLAGLFHVAYLFFGVLAGATDLFVEVNPRHAKFYERMLGFKQKGECRTCARVEAPAVLMHLETAHIARRISAAQARQRSSEHSWYAYSLSKEQEAKVLAEVIAATRPAALGNVQQSGHTSSLVYSEAEFAG
jgi:hypothetical protein